MQTHAQHEMIISGWKSSQSNTETYAEWRCLVACGILARPHRQLLRPIFCLHFL